MNEPIIAEKMENFNQQFRKFIKIPTLNYIFIEFFYYSFEKKYQKEENEYKEKNHTVQEISKKMYTINKV